MNFDALTVGAVCAELRATLLGGRVQRVHLPDEHGLAMELYAQGGGRSGEGGQGSKGARWLYASAHPQRARLHLVAARPPRPSDDVTPLLLLLRKYVDAGRLDAVTQPDLERIVRLDFTKRAPTGELWRTTLVVEVLGRQSNLVLLDADGTVMDAARRVGPQQSRSRIVLPQRRYDPPPVPDRLDPRWLEPDALAAAAGDYPPGGKLRELLVAEVQACSPLQGREVVYGVHGAADAPVSAGGWEAIAAAFGAVWRAAAADAWGPSVAVDGERLVAYAAYPLRSFPDVQAVTSISRAVENWFAQTPTGAAAGAGAGAPDSLAARKAPLRQALEAGRDRLRAKRFSLQRALVDEREVTRLRRAGEHLLAFGGELAPGQERFTLPDDETELALDPALTAVENARRYFARYAKARGAAVEVPALLAAAEHELSYLDEALTHLDLAGTPDELAALRAEWAEGGYLGPQLRPKAPRPAGRGRGRGGAARGGARGRDGGRPQAAFRRVLVDGFEVLVGRSGRGNDALLTREAHPLDVWLHARGIPGGHVLVRAAGRAVPETVLRRAAALAAGQSQARTAPSVAVDYTLRRYVDRIKGGPPGLVTYRGERTLHVPPAGLEA
jgi:predicted ribosome quality control (RQC) complex YloA/Tae2 family protein